MSQHLMRKLYPTELHIFLKAKQSTSKSQTKSNQIYIISSFLAAPQTSTDRHFFDRDYLKDLFLNFAPSFVLNFRLRELPLYAIANLFEFRC